MRILSKSHGYPWDLSDQFPSNPMSILSKSHGDHGICQISSHQIQWESYQNLMVTMGFVRSVPIKSYENLITISWWPCDLSEQLSFSFFAWWAVFSCVLWCCCHPTLIDLMDWAAHGLCQLCMDLHFSWKNENILIDLISQIQMHIHGFDGWRCLRIYFNGSCACNADS